MTPGLSWRRKAGEARTARGRRDSGRGWTRARGAGQVHTRHLSKGAGDACPGPHGGQAGAPWRGAGREGRGMDGHAELPLTRAPSAAGPPPCRCRWRGPRPLPGGSSCPRLAHTRPGGNTWKYRFLHLVTCQVTPSAFYRRAPRVRRHQGAGEGVRRADPGPHPTRTESETRRGQHSAAWPALQLIPMSNKIGGS